MFLHLREHLTLWHALAIAGALVMIAVFLAMIVGPHFPFTHVSTAIDERIIS
jgi:hypothetical protein